MTSCVPTSATEPGTGEIFTVVAFSTCHSNVDVAPAVMLSGLAENRSIFGADPGVTCTDTLHVAVPTLFAAVMV